MSEEQAGQQREQNVSAREARVLHEWGAGFEAFCRTLDWKGTRQQHVYQVQVRAPVREGADWLLMVKAVGEEHPLIAFHTGEGALQVILSWGSRFEAGKIQWKEDGFPPEKYDEIEAFIREALQYKASRGWD